MPGHLPGALSSWSRSEHVLNMRFDKWFLRAARQLGRLAAAWGLSA
jgi:hypothetical protein